MWHISSRESCMTSNPQLLPHPLPLLSKPAVQAGKPPISVSSTCCLLRLSLLLAGMGSQ